MRDVGPTGYGVRRMDGCRAGRTPCRHRATLQRDSRSSPAALNARLTIDGNRREACGFYRSIFGFDFAGFQTHADGPPEMSDTEGAGDFVLHLALPMGSSGFMGADWSPRADSPLVAENDFSIGLEDRSREHCESVFAGGRSGDDAASEDVLGHVFRELHRPVCRPPDDQLPAA